LYILPPGYPADRQVELLFYDPPDWQTQEYFADILRLNLLAGFPEEITLRAIEEPQVSIHSLTSGRSFPAAGPNAGTLATLILAVIYMFALFPIAEILVGALGDEKANRTIEIVLTSIKPSQLMLGKIAAVIGMVLVEIVAWLLMVILAVWIGGTWFHVKWMQNVTIPWWDVLQFTLLAVSGLAFYCAAMVFVGSLLHEREEIRQAASLVILPVFLPLYVLPALLETPNGPIALAFALLPITSVQAQGIQLFLIPVSAWITISAIAINLASAGLCAWLASIAFRQASLRYGQAVKLGSLFGRPKVR
jgi:ABC-2 type transport system permease protein